MTAARSATPAAALDARFAHHVRARITPRWPLRLPGGGMDGVARRRGALLERLLHVGGGPVVVRAAQPAGGDVVIGAWADDEASAGEAIARMRFALGVDDDLAPFVERFRHDRLIGASVRRRPHLRVTRRPVAFEALAWAICEQLIAFDHAAAIERAIVRRLGRHDVQTGLSDLPAVERFATMSPTLLRSLGLSERRALALVGCAREVAAGRVDLDGADHEAGWARLRRIPGIGTWTIDVLALHGQGRHDRVPAGDLNLLKFVGRLAGGGDPRARATEADVRAVFGPYGAWAGRAAAHALRMPFPAQPPSSGVSASPTPSPGRNSLVNARAAGSAEEISPSPAIQVA